MREYQSVKCLSLQFGREFALNVEHPAVLHVTPCKLCLGRSLRDAKHLKLRAPSFQQRGVITCTAAYVKDARAPLTEQVNQGRISEV